MNDTAKAGARFGEGPLSQVAGWLYALLVTGMLGLVAVLPGVVGMGALVKDVSNVPLVACCAIPFGPAMAATLFALHNHRGDLTELHPAPAFLRGYRLNLWPVLRLWLPLLAGLAVIGVNLTRFAAAGVPGWWGTVLVVLAVLGVLWGVNALVITSLFVFRARDVARLAVYFLVAAPGVTVANACLLIVAGAVIHLFGELVLALLLSVLALMMLRTCEPLTTRVRREFTA